MVPFIEDFIQLVLRNFLKVLKFDGVIDCAFRAEEQLSKFMGRNLDSIYIVMQSFAIYLIILKFLKKGFDTYVLWNDGDAELDPLILLTGLFKGVIITLSFDTLYNLLIDISEDLTNKLLESIALESTATVNVTIDNLLIKLLGGGIALCITAVIYYVMYVILYIQFMKKGLELFVLKAGLPLACVGLMDSDGGVFRPYTKKFFQEVFSVMIQIVMLKFSMALFIGSHYLWGFAAISFAISAPHFLNEFIMTSGGGGLSKVSSAAHVVSVAKSFVK